MNRRIALLSLTMALLAGSLLSYRSLMSAPAADASAPQAFSFPFDPETQEPQTLVCNVEDGSELLPCHALVIADYQEPFELAPLSNVSCVGGMAGSYPCNNVDLLSFMPLNQMGGGSGNDIWGWTDPSTGKEYALMGRTSGTAFIDISDPLNPVYLGNLPSESSSSIWRDIKTYNNHAFIVADYAGSHGMQVFDLTALRNVSNPPQTFRADTVYANFGSAHNIVINEETGFAYAVGVSNGGTSCAGGLHMVNIQDPQNPTFAGCFSGDGYTHDAQCVVYNGPDTAYQGQELCFNANTDTLTVVDVTTKNAPEQLSRTGYSTSGYTHQGWLTEDHRYYVMDDELDEGPQNTRTYIWDVSDVDAPILINTYTADTPSIDHNLYIKDGVVYQANYRAGLRLLDAADIANGNLSEIGFFDVYPANDAANFNGAWSNYPYFDSGVIIVSGIEQGLFVLRRANAQSTYLPFASSE